jgi:hypothetical protein
MMINLKVMKLPVGTFLDSPKPSAQVDLAPSSSNMPLETKEIETRPFLDYSDDEASELQAPQYRPTESRQSKLLPYSLVFTVTSIFWIAILAVVSNSTPQRKSTSNGTYHSGDRHNITSHAHLLECGHSASEARAQGCEYDILLNMWVPAPCIETEFIHEYQDDESWGAYADEELTLKLSLEQMSQMPFYYTSARDHINHCAVLWKKQFWVLYEERREFDSVIASGPHTDHCAQFLMDAPEMDRNKSTKVVPGFAGCWIRH